MLAASPWVPMRVVASAWVPMRVVFPWVPTGGVVGRARGWAWVPTRARKSGIIAQIRPFLRQKAGRDSRGDDHHHDHDHHHLRPSRIDHNSSGKLGFRGVSVYAPDGRLLLKDLNLSLQRGTNVMMTGPNGAGKTSLFRVLSGLWKGFGGTIYRPRAMTCSDLFYMPQNPYLVDGTLRDQVTYPCKLSNTDRDPQIKALLKKVGLGKLLGGAAADDDDGDDGDGDGDDDADDVPCPRSFLSSIT